MLENKPSLLRADPTWEIIPSERLRMLRLYMYLYHVPLPVQMYLNVNCEVYLHGVHAKVMGSSPG